MLPGSMLAGTLTNSHPIERTSSHLGTHCQGYPPPHRYHCGSKTKREFKVTATVIAATVLREGGAVVETVPLTQTATMAKILNQVVAKSAKALRAQELINQHLYPAIHALQQQVDCLTEELTLMKNMSLLV